MKHFRIAFLIAFVLTVAVSIVSLSAEAKNIRSSVFRLHVRADSNTTQAQKIKLDVKDSVVEYVGRITENAGSANDAQQLVSEHIDEIKSVADSTLAELGCSYAAEVCVVKEYFPTKEYGNVALPCGNYNALCVNLGSGEGENWWCMLYPELCYGEADDSEISDTLGNNTADTLKDKECYKFRILEIAGILFG